MFVIRCWFARGRDELDTTTTDSLPSPYDNVQTPPSDATTSRRRHSGMTGYLQATY